LRTVALPSGERVSAFGQGVIVIPRTSRRERLKENLGALDHRLTTTQLAELDRLFPPPTRTRPLEML
jgi:Aldo/keto reductases, related to diketogulonate reductase